MSHHDISGMLNNLLADYMVYYQKLRNYHWNVKGKEFFKLHEKFEEAYNESAMFVDEIAERILALDATPYSTMADFVEHADLDEDHGSPGYEEMVRTLIEDIEKLNNKSYDITEGAEEHRDRTTANLLDDIVDAQEERKWMFKQFLAA